MPIGDGATSPAITLVLYLRTMGAIERGNVQQVRLERVIPRPKDVYVVQRPVAALPYLLYNHARGELYRRVWRVGSEIRRGCRIEILLRTSPDSIPTFGRNARHRASRPRRAGP